MRIKKKDIQGNYKVIVEAGLPDDSCRICKLRQIEVFYDDKVYTCREVECQLRAQESIDNTK